MKKRLSWLVVALGLTIGMAGTWYGMKLIDTPAPPKTAKEKLAAIIDRENPFGDMTKEENDQVPKVGNLPCHDGQMFVYEFTTRDVRRWEGLFMLASHLMYEELSGNKFKVRIVILHGPKRTILMTADYVGGMIEMREEWNHRDKYRMWTWHGDDLTTIARYLVFGIHSNPDFIRGRRSAEKVPVQGETACPHREGV